MSVTEPPPVAAQYVVTFLKPEMLHLYRQITALRAYRPVVFCQKREQPDAFPFSPIVLLPKPRSHSLRRVWQKQILGQPITIYRSEARRILGALHAAQARVLHIYFGHIGVHLLPLLEIADLPIVVSFHGADAQIDLHKPAHLIRTRRMFDRATLLLVRSQSIAARLVSIGADESKIRVHRTGIPLQEITFAPRSAPPDGSWHWVQACRLIPKKGLITTLQAFAEFRRAFPLARLTIAGEGPQLDELRALAATLEVSGHVSFAGFLGQAALRKLFSEAHLFVHPSELTAEGDQEGVPNSMLEAMASGLPVAATRHGGIPEAVQHGVSGVLVAERGSQALAKEVLELVREPARFAAMSRAAHEMVRTDFDLAAQARVLEGHYTEAIRLASPR
ncbi:MAG: hypothetical protein JWQ44_642 [Chthoniobacter sp.]|nr:hypothetical protein [Chthoniobacter sp.]